MSVFIRWSAYLNNQSEWILPPSSCHWFYMLSWSKTSDKCGTVQTLLFTPCRLSLTAVISPAPRLSHSVCEPSEVFSWRGATVALVHGAKLSVCSLVCFILFSSFMSFHSFVHRPLFYLSICGFLSLTLHPMSPPSFPRPSPFILPHTLLPSCLLITSVCSSLFHPSVKAFHLSSSVDCSFDLSDATASSPCSSDSNVSAVITRWSGASEPFISLGWSCSTWASRQWDTIPSISIWMETWMRGEATTLRPPSAICPSTTPSLAA